MKALGKLLGEFIAWRWFPAVGLCIASLFYVLVVVALVPDEIGVPVTNARFAKKLAPTGDEKPPERSTFPNAMPETEPAPPPPVAQVQPAGVVDFGRRGFSPPLERPEPPPPPPPPPPPTPIVTPPPVAAAPPPVVATPAAEAPPAEVPGATASPPGDAPPPPASAPAAPGTASPMQPFRRGLPFPRNVLPLPGLPPAVPQPPTGQPAPGEAPAPPPAQ